MKRIRVKERPKKPPVVLPAVQGGCPVDKGHPCGS